MKELIARIRATLANLSPRERLLVAVAGGVFLVLVLLVGVINPVLSASSRASRRVEAA